MRDKGLGPTDVTRDSGDTGDTHQKRGAETVTVRTERNPCITSTKLTKCRIDFCNRTDVSAGLILGGHHYRSDNDGFAGWP
jgi:hypothetical protein